MDGRSSMNTPLPLPTSGCWSHRSKTFQTRGCTEQGYGQTAACVARPLLKYTCRMIVRPLFRRPNLPQLVCTLALGFVCLAPAAPLARAQDDNQLHTASKE